MNTRFFDTSTRTVAYVLGVIWSWGSVKTHTRQVLRLRCPRGKEPVLQSILLKMDSKHSLQAGKRRTLVEIGNSHFVESLVKNYGKPPDRSAPDPPLPAIASEFTRSFAKGFLDAAAEITLEQIRISGPTTALNLIQQAVSSATGQRPTKLGHGRGRTTAVWRGVVEVLAFRRWHASLG